MTRGLPLNGDDISYHGLYGILPRQIISTDALERVEVFKGRNAFINGVPPGGSGIGGDGRVGEKSRRGAEDAAGDNLRHGVVADLGGVRGTAHRVVRRAAALSPPRLRADP